MRIAITGSEGYLAGALIHMLATSAQFQDKNTPELLLLDVLPGGDGDGDITRSEVRLAVRDWNPDVIVNFAGLSGETRSSRDTYKAWAVNAYAPNQLRKLVSRALFIQASTCSIYDAGHKESSYAASKMYAEEILQLFSPNDLILPRFGTVFGWSESDRMRWDLPLHRMALDAVDKREITIPKDRMDRPWTLICDLMDAVCRWINAYAEGFRFKSAGPFPVVSFNATLNDIAGVLQEITTCKITYTEATEQYKDKRNYAAPGTLGGHTARAHVGEMVNQIVEKAYERSLSESASALPAKAGGQVRLDGPHLKAPDDGATG